MNPELAVIKLELEITSHAAAKGEVRVILRPPGLAHKGLPLRQPSGLNAELHLVGTPSELPGAEHGKRYKLTLTELETT